MNFHPLNPATETRKRNAALRYIVKFSDGEFVETTDPIHTILSCDGLIVEYVIDLDKGDATQYWLTEVEDRLREISQEGDDLPSHEWSRDRIRRYYERGL